MYDSTGIIRKKQRLFISHVMKSSARTQLGKPDPRRRSSKAHKYSFPARGIEPSNSTRVALTHNRPRRFLKSPLLFLHSDKLRVLNVSASYPSPHAVSSHHAFGPSSLPLKPPTTTHDRNALIHDHLSNPEVCGNPALCRLVLRDRV